MTDARPHSNGDAPPRHWTGSPPPPQGNAPSPTPPTEPASLLLRRFRAPRVDPVERGPGTTAPSQVAPREPESRFLPDELLDQRGSPPPGFAYVASSGEPSPRPRAGMAARLAGVVIFCVVATTLLAVAHIGPFSSYPGGASTPSTTASPPPDVRGTWNALVGFGSTLYTEPLHIDTEDLATGGFSAAITSPVGIETMSGTVEGSTMTFSISLGKSIDSGSATVTTVDGKLRIQGEFSSSSGGHGTIVATRL